MLDTISTSFKPEGAIDSTACYRGGDGIRALDALHVAFLTAACEADALALAIDQHASKAPSQDISADALQCSQHEELLQRPTPASPREAKCEAEGAKMQSVMLSASEKQTDTEPICELAAPLLAGGSELPPWPFGLGVVLGPSSSGKTSWLRHLHQHYATYINKETDHLSVLRQREAISHEDAEQIDAELCRAIASHPALGTDRLNRLQSVGLNDVPAWTRPLHVLSNGQRARFELATKLGSGMVVDDFAATIDSHTACSTAAALAKIVRRGSRGIIVGTTREEVVPWLSPDFVIFAPTGELFQRPSDSKAQAPEVSLQPHFGHFVRTSETSNGERCGWQPLKHAPLDQGVGKATSKPWAAGDREYCWHTHKVRCEEVLKCRVQLDDHVIEAAGAFEYSFDGNCETRVPLLEKRMLQTKFAIGVIIGPSGTGKSTLLNKLGRNQCTSWSNGTSVLDTVAEALADNSLALDLLRALALPTGCLHRTRQQLSNGEGSRADAALALAHASASGSEDMLGIDEWTSELDRQTAKAVCKGLSNWLRKDGRAKVAVVLATVHEDTAEWLQPDWVFDTGTWMLSKRTAKLRSERKSAAQPLSQGETIEFRPDAEKFFTIPRLKLEVHSLRHLSFDELKTVWSSYFASHHYLKGTLQGVASCVLVREESSGTPVAFHATIPQPGLIQAAWREHRLVVRPQWQGLGIGPRLSNLMAARFHVDGMCFYSTTAHPRLAACRCTEGSPWKPCNSSAPDGKRSCVAGQGYGFNKDLSKTTAAITPDMARQRTVYSHRYDGHCGRPPPTSKDKPTKCDHEKCCLEAKLDTLPVAKVKRQKFSEEQRTWVCPVLGCGHRMIPGTPCTTPTAGQIAHVAKHHRQKEHQECGCKHGCPKCVPREVLDSTAFLFRLAVANKDGLAIGQALASTDVFPNSGLSTELVAARTSFLHAALETLGAEERATLKKDILSGAGTETLRSTSSQQILEQLDIR